MQAEREINDFYHEIIDFEHLIIDMRGRSLEAGTAPHYFNSPGLDALETVLELIENLVFF